jgi:chloramphenicol 3-O phosphotransferase
MSKVGKVIVLNGTSSSGKTTIAKAIQSKSSDIYLLCSLDAFWDMTPYGVPAGSVNFPNMKLALAKSVRALAETGHNVIVDVIFCGPKTFSEFKRELNALELVLVKVECPIEELRIREISRGDRKVGLAESQIESVHDNVVYDVSINTLDNSPSDCADKIMKHLTGQ